jgi:hypothetical protein
MGTGIYVFLVLGISSCKNIYADKADYPKHYCTVCLNKRLGCGYNIVKQPNRVVSQLALVVFICDRPERITRQYALHHQQLSNEISGQC